MSRLSFKVAPRRHRPQPPDLVPIMGAFIAAIVIGVACWAVIITAALYAVRAL